MSARFRDAAPALTLALLLAGRGGALALPLAAALALFAVLLAPAAFAAIVRRRARRPGLGWLDAAGGVFLGVYALSGVFGVYPGAAVLAIATAVLAAGVFRAAATSAMDPGAARAQAIAIVVIAASGAALGVGQSLAGGGPARWPATWPLVNHDHLASLLAAVLPLAIVLSRNRGGDALHARVPAAAARVAAVCIAAGLVFTVSRAGIAAALVPAGLAIGLSLRRGARADIVIPGIAAAAVVAVAALIVTGPMAARLAAPTLAVSAGERAELVRDSWKTFESRPWRGSGAGGFRTSFLAYRAPEIPYRVDHAHMDVLELAVESGVPGVAAALAFAAIWIGGVVRGRREDNPLCAIAEGATLGVVAILLHGLADFPLHVPAIAVAAAWLGGLAAGSATVRRAGRREYGPEREPSPLGDRARAFAGAAAAIVAGTLVISTLHAAGAASAGSERALHLSPWNAGVWRAAADVARDRGIAGDPAEIDRAIALYRAALARNPNDPDAASSLGRLELLSGQDDAALADFGRAVAADPANPVWMTAYAEALFAAHRSREALDELRWLAQNRRDTDRALAIAWDNETDVTSVTEIAPQGAEGRARLGTFLASKGEDAAARAAFDAAANVEPDEYAGLAAAAAERAGDAKAAIAWLDRALAGADCGAAKRAPFFARRARLRLGSDVAGARADARCARELDPSRIDAWLAVADAEAAAGDHDAAHAAWRAAADHFPEDPSPLVALARDLEKTGDADAALAAARAAESRRTCDGVGALEAARLLEGRGLAANARLRLEELRARCPQSRAFADALAALDARAR